MYLAGRWYTLDSRRGAGRIDRIDDRRLDVAGCRTAVLEPLLGIGDVRTDKRIDFVGGVARHRGARAPGRQRQGGRRVLAFPVTRRRPDGDLRRRRHHAAQVHLVRAQAARRPAGPPDLTRHPDASVSGGIHESPGRRQVRADRARRPRRPPAARSSTSPSSRTTRSSQAIAATRRRGPGRALAPRSPRRCSTPARLALVVRAGAGYNTIDVAAASRARHLRRELPGQERDRRRRARFGADPGARPADPRQRRGPARRQLEQEGVLARRAASTGGRSACSAPAASARR